MTFTPTTEQQVCLDLASNGGHLRIEAGAGTGKTATLRLIADLLGDKKFLYLAFNKSIVQDAAGRFPGNVTCKTAHSLAFGVIGKNFKHRLDTGRVRSWDIAKILKVGPMFLKTADGGTKVLQPAKLAGIIMRAVNNFCLTGDEAPAPYHMSYVDGIDQPDATGRRTFVNNNIVREQMFPFVQKAWEDVQRRDGTLPFTHNAYLKLYQLSQPNLSGYDVLLYDEAQDANGCMLAIVNAQAGRCQIIAVGDTNQQIYEWNGSVNALEKFPAQNTAWLTQSFRFGDAIAASANQILSQLDTPLRLTGNPATTSKLSLLRQPKAILTRTNACAVTNALGFLAAGRRVALVGGAQDVVSFAKAAQNLKEGRSTEHPELSCFETWLEVQEYVAQDELAGDLKMLVKLIDEFGVQEIIDGLGATVEEAHADVIISTAHKAKGREWDTVQIAGDFPDVEKRDLSDEEFRLLYVAVTRAKFELDITAVSFFMKLSDPPAADDNDEDGDDDGYFIRPANFAKDDGFDQEPY